MADLTVYTIKDMYAGKILRVKDEQELSEWLRKSYATLTDGQEDMINCLAESFVGEDMDGIKWYGAACGLEITQKKRTRRKTK